MKNSTNISPDFVIHCRQDLGAKIKAKRKELNMDQATLGEAVGVQATTISKIEAGKFPTQIDMYIKIGIALNFKIEFI